MGSDSQDIQQHMGCGTELNLSQITLNVNTTTGGCFSVNVDSQTSVENLKKIVAKKLKVAKDRICLLHREKELHDGTSLKENGIMDGSRIILLPNVETGLLAQRPENTVMQALESLNDSQVNDFLSGKTPLNLSMRLGDHMMLIQLQLSTVNPTNATTGSSSSSASASASAATSPAANGQHRSRSGMLRSRTSSARPSHTATSTPSTPSNPYELLRSNSNVELSAGSEASGSVTPLKAGSRSCKSSPEQTPTKQQLLPQQLQQASRSRHHHHHHSSSAATKSEQQRDLVLSNEEFESLRSIVHSLTNMQNDGDGSEELTDSVIQQVDDVDIEMGNGSTFDASTSADALLEQSPIKSLSNLVSSPIKTIPLNNIPITSTPHVAAATSATAVATAATNCTDPISAKLTSCLCKRFVANSNDQAAGCSHDCQMSRSQQQQQMQKLAKTTRSSTSLLRRTLNNPIARAHNGHHHHHHRPDAGYSHFRPSAGAVGTATPTHSHHHHHHRHRHGASCSPSASSLRRSQSSDNVRLMDVDDLNRETLETQPIEVIDTAAGSSVDGAGSNSDTLAEASRNLTKTLRKLSKEVFTNKVDVAAIAGADETTNVRSRASGSGASSTSSNANAAGNQVTSNSAIGNVSGIGSGAVIESMRNHGRGIYSGTFSGTLNPALQDRYGRPKRDISTVIHILNDLLSATPHYSRGARISFEPAQSSRSSKYSSSKRSSGSTAGSSASTSNSATTSGSHSHRDHCSKCVSLKSCTYSDSKTLVCRRTAGAHSARHDASKASTSLPSTPVTSNVSSLDCHQCHMRLSNSAPVTPTSAPQSISFSDASFTDDSTVSSVTSTPEARACASAPKHATSSAPSSPICVKCSNIEIENSKTKTKLDQLRLVMQQRRERREARKMKVAPYGARIIGTTTSPTQSASTANASDSSNNTSVLQTAIDGPTATSAIVEQVDTLA